MEIISIIIHSVLMLSIISEIVSINIKLTRQNKQIKNLLFLIDRQKEKINEIEEIKKKNTPE